MSAEKFNVTRRKILSEAGLLISGAILGAAAVRMLNTLNRLPHEVVIGSRGELRATFSTHLKWLTTKLNTASGYGPVTGAHGMIGTMKQVLEQLIQCCNRAIRSIDVLDVLIADSKGEMTPQVIKAALLARQYVDEGEKLISEFKGELERLGSPIRRFDRIARGIDVET